MPYIRYEYRERVNPALYCSMAVVNDYVNHEESLYSIISQLLQRYIYNNFSSSHDSVPSPPPECDPISSDISSVFSDFGEDEIEGVLNFFISSLLGMTICTEIRYCYINRSIGVLQRVAGFINGRKHWGVEGIRLSRSLGVLSCVEDELYRRLAGPYEDEAIAKNGDIPFYQR